MRLVDHCHLAQVKLLLHNLLFCCRANPLDDSDSRPVGEPFVMWLRELVKNPHDALKVHLQYLVVFLLPHVLSPEQSTCLFNFTAFTLSKRLYVTLENLLESICFHGA